MSRHASIRDPVQSAIHSVAESMHFVAESMHELEERISRVSHATTDFVAAHAVPLALAGLGAGWIALSMRHMQDGLVGGGWTLRREEEGLLHASGTVRRAGTGERNVPQGNDWREGSQWTHGGQTAQESVNCAKKAPS